MSNLLRTVIGSLEDFLHFGLVVVLFIFIFDIAGVEVSVEFACRSVLGSRSVLIVWLRWVCLLQLLGGKLAFEDGYHARANFDNVGWGAITTFQVKSLTFS